MTYILLVLRRTFAVEESIFPTVAKLYERADRALYETRELAKIHHFVMSWIRSRPSPNVRRTSL
jgi:hypothetical protein